MTTSDRGETYFDIVWRQFKANRPAYYSVWVAVPLVLVAVLAPALASNVPLAFRDDGQTLFPWFRALFNAEEPIDQFFNMGLVAMVPTAAVVAILWRRWHRRTRRTRLLRSAGIYVALTLLLTLIFAVPQLRPLHKYRARSFTEEEFRSATKQGWYAPVPFGPVEQDLDAVFRGPMFRKPQVDWRESNDGFPHLLGTDDTGRDVLVQMIYGTRIAITVGLLAVAIYLSIGSVIGALAGYFGGAVDVLISRIIEVVLLFPAFFLILTLVAMIGPSIYIIMLVIGLTGWPSIARLVRAEVLKQRGLEYVMAARALGNSHRRIIFRHILPNSLSSALVAASFGISGAIVTEAGLSLLGFGVRPPTPSWGMLLRLGSDNYHYWWLVVVPSLAIFFTVTIFNLISSGLRDAMDPRLRNVG